MTRSDASSGFTLIELLVVIAVVAILASIAIPQYSFYKRRTIDASIESGMNSARISMESAFGSNDYTYVGLTETMLHDDYGFRKPAGFTLQIMTATASRFVLRGCQIGGNWPSFVYDSDLGTLVGDSGTCP